MSARGEKGPIPLAHDLPVESPTGRPPRNPLVVIIGTIVGLLVFVGLLWVIDVLGG